MNTTRRTATARTVLKAIYAAALFALFVFVLQGFAAPSAYAADSDPIAQGTSGTCTWVIDADGKLIVSPTEGDTGTLGEWDKESGVPWYEYRTQITSVEFEGAVTAKTCGHMFHGCQNAASINLKGLVTSDVYRMNYMFFDCRSLESIAFQGLDTSRVRTMNMMFYDCVKLKELDISSFDTSSALTMEGMFESCSALTSLDLSSKDTSNVTNMGYLFNGCSSLTKLIIKGLNTSKVTSMMDMFSGCSNLTAIDISGFDMGNVSNTQSMFGGCKCLTSITFPPAWGQKTTSFSGMFSSCTSLSELDLSGLSTPVMHTTNMMFFSCSALERIYVGEGWTTDNVTESLDMFLGCTSLVGGNGTTYSEEHAKDAEYARVDTEGSPGYLTLKTAGSGSENGGSETQEGGNGNNSGGSGDGTDTPTGNTDSPQSNTPADSPAKDGNSSSASPSAGTAKATIAKAKVKLSKTTFTYDDKAHRPSVKVFLNGKALKLKRDFTVTYSKGRKAIGTYKVTVTGKGAYKGKVKASFKIVPKAPKLASIKAHKNSDGTSGFIVKWSKPKGGAFGYKLRWSNSKKFKKCETVTFAKSTVFAKKRAAALLVRNKSWRGKDVFVQVRAFAKVKGKTYTSNWSKAKTVKIKK